MKTKNVVGFDEAVKDEEDSMRRMVAEAEDDNERIAAELAQAIRPAILSWIRSSGGTSEQILRASSVVFAAQMVECILNVAKEGKELQLANVIGLLMAQYMADGTKKMLDENLGENAPCFNRKHS